jgi:hypothetical protein
MGARNEQGNSADRGTSREWFLALHMGNPTLQRPAVSFNFLEVQDNPMGGGRSATSKDTWAVSSGFLRELRMITPASGGGGNVPSPFLHAAAEAERAFLQTG